MAQQNEKGEPEEGVSSDIHESAGKINFSSALEAENRGEKVNIPYPPAIIVHDETARLTPNT